jgi:hypothetical protein
MDSCGFVAAMDQATDAVRRFADSCVAAAAAVAIAESARREDRRCILAEAYERAGDAYVAAGDAEDLGAMLAAVGLGAGRSSGHLRESRRQLGYPHGRPMNFARGLQVSRGRHAVSRRFVALAATVRRRERGHLAGFDRIKGPPIQARCVGWMSWCAVLVVACADEFCGGE